MLKEIKNIEINQKEKTVRIRLDPNFFPTKYILKSAYRISKRAKVLFEPTTEHINILLVSKANNLLELVSDFNKILITELYPPKKLSILQRIMKPKPKEKEKGKLEKISINVGNIQTFPKEKSVRIALSLDIFEKKYILKGLVKFFKDNYIIIESDLKKNMVNIFLISKIDRSLLELGYEFNEELLRLCHSEILEMEMTRKEKLEKYILK